MNKNISVLSNTFLGVLIVTNLYFLSAYFGGNETNTPKFLVLSFSVGAFAAILVVMSRLSRQSIQARRVLKKIIISSTDEIEPEIEVPTKVIIKVPKKENKKKTVWVKKVLHKEELKDLKSRIFTAVWITCLKGGLFALVAITLFKNFDFLGNQFGIFFPKFEGWMPIDQDSHSVKALIWCFVFGNLVRFSNSPINRIEDEALDIYYSAEEDEEGAKSGQK